MLPYLAQGANVSFEDAAVLGFLFGKVTHRNQIRTALTMYEKLRKERAELITRFARAHREVVHLSDGEEQVRRDTEDFARSFKMGWW